MNCPNCGELINKQKNFCPNCGIHIKKGVDQEINISNASVGIGIGNGNIVKVKKIENNINTEDIKKVTCTYLVKGKGMKYNSLKSFSTFTMIIGLISSLLTIVTVFVDINNVGFASKILPWTVVVGGIGGYLLIICKDLNKSHGFSWLRPFKFLSIILKKLDNGKIVRIKLNGKCVECDGDIKFYKGYEDGKIRGYCNNNSEHYYEFDYTNFMAKRISNS